MSVSYIPRQCCSLASCPRKRESRAQAPRGLDARLRGHDVLLVPNLRNGHLGCVPRGAEVEELGAFLDEVGKGWHLEGAGDAVMDVVIETDPQFGRGHRKRHKGVPRRGALASARPEAHIPLAHACPRSQFGGVVVEGDLGMYEHHQQTALLGTRLGYPL